MRLAHARLFVTTLALAACPGRSDDSGTDTDATTAATSSDPSGATTMTSTDPSGTTTGTTAPTTGATALTGDEVVPCAGEVPPHGSGPCAIEGEDCKFEDDPCVAFTGAQCIGGVWNHYEHTPGPECEEAACDPPNSPVEGAPCSPEGASCFGDCWDQCSFCNGWMCQDGAWQGLEVFPAPCLECDAMCDFVLAPMCAGGPPDEAACVGGCEDNKVGPCKVEFSALRACAGQRPSFTCDAAERPLVPGCEAQFEAFYVCLMP